MQRRWREAQMFARNLAAPDHPILAQIVPIRRCNLSCTYCNEYDKTSPPVATDVMIRRLDKLSELGTQIITFTYQAKTGKYILQSDTGESFNSTEPNKIKIIKNQKANWGKVSFEDYSNAGD